MKERPCCSKRPQHFGDAKNVQQLPTAAMERKQTDLRRQSVLATDGAGAVIQAFRGSQEIMSGSQTLDSKLFTLLEFDFALLRLLLCPGSSLVT